MGEAFIVRRGGVSSEETAAPTITIISEDPTGVTFTVTNNDDNTAFITFEIDDTLDVIELAAAATSTNITVALTAGTYTLTAFATVVGEVATSATASVEIVVPEYEELFSTTVTTATTEIDITSLSIGKDDTVRMVYTFVGDDASTTSLYTLQVNNITANYHCQTLDGDGVNLPADRRTDSLLSFARLTEESGGFADIKVSNNDRFVYQTQFIGRGLGSAANQMRNFNANGVNTGTVTSITSLKIVCNRTNGIAIGSKIALYKVTEAA